MAIMFVGGVVLILDGILKLFLLQETYGVGVCCSHLNLNPFRGKAVTRLITMGSGGNNNLSFNSCVRNSMESAIENQHNTSHKHHHFGRQRAPLIYQQINNTNRIIQCGSTFIDCNVVLYTVVANNEIDYDKKCRQITVHFDDHGDAAVQFGAYHPMEHIPGFTRCNCMPQSGECMGRIAPRWPPWSLILNETHKH